MCEAEKCAALRRKRMARHLCGFFSEAGLSTSGPLSWELTLKTVVIVPAQPTQNIIRYYRALIVAATVDGDFFMLYVPNDPGNFICYTS